MRRRPILLVSLMLFLTILSPLILATPPTINLTKFSDDTTEKVISFPGGGGYDESAALEFPKKAVVTEASFNVSTVPDALGNYPTKPYIDVGADGDHEWGFYGSGYGDFGRQDEFSNGERIRDVKFDENETFNTSAKIILPKNATVTSAVMTINSIKGVDN
jgi:hypothetical protein